MRILLFVVATLALLGLVFVSQGNAESFATVSLDAVDYGNFRSDGYHLSTDLNYLAGRSDTTGRTDKAFFLFDLARIQGEVTSAKLRAWNPSNGYSGIPQETFAIFQVSAATVPSLRTSWGENDPTGVAVFQDLSSNPSLGSTIVTTASNANWVEIPLNSDGVLATNSARQSGQSPQLFAIGGAITSLTGYYQFDNYVPEFIFGHTDDDPLHLPPAPQLVVTFQTPEPGTMAYLGALGLIGLFVGWRRWRAGRLRS